jgi:hypothetical protein
MNPMPRGICDWKSGVGLITALKDAYEPNAERHLSLLESDHFPSLPDSQNLTDIYLLGLAVKHGGRLATFDANMGASRVTGGHAAFQRIPTD